MQKKDLKNQVFQGNLLSPCRKKNLVSSLFEAPVRYKHSSFFYLKLIFLLSVCEFLIKEKNHASIVSLAPLF